MRETIRHYHMALDSVLYPDGGESDRDWTLSLSGDQWFDRYYLRRLLRLLWGLRLNSEWSWISDSLVQIYIKSESASIYHLMICIYTVWMGFACLFIVVVFSSMPVQSLPDG